MESETFLGPLAQLLGSPEPALRLLVTILSGYPLVIIHRFTLHRKDPTAQHVYFICCGLAMGIFNYGWSIMHSAICLLACWLTLLLIGGTILSVIVTFVFQMVYLLLGYYYTATDTYDIKWTMPQCVMTLRLIALAWDMYDGRKKQSELSVDQRKTSLETLPSLLAVSSHTYFPSAFLVGPQFSMRRYLDYINGTLYDMEKPPCIGPGLLVGLYGMTYIAVYQFGIHYIPDNYLTSDAFNAQSWWMRHLLVGIWGKVALYKYIACWLVAEGVCIVSGLSYCGKDLKGRHMWHGCSNVRIGLFERATQFRELIASFNLNTNSWVAHYVYKRLKFMNNVYVSQMAALVFLAVWHGLHSGYYACFFMEFVVMFFEKDLSSYINRYPKLTEALQSKPFKYLLFIIMKIYVLVFMGYCLGPFVLLKSDKWWSFYSSLFFSGHVFFAGWFVYGPLVKLLIRTVGGKPTKRDEKKETGIGNDKRKEE